MSEDDELLAGWLAGPGARPTEADRVRWASRQRERYFDYPQDARRHYCEPEWWPTQVGQTWTCAPAIPLGKGTRLDGGRPYGARPSRQPADASQSGRLHSRLLVRRLLAVRRIPTRVGTPVQRLQGAAVITQIAVNSQALINLAAKLEQLGYAGDDVHDVAERIALNLLSDGYRRVEAPPPLRPERVASEAVRKAAVKTASDAISAAKMNRTSAQPTPEGARP
jgi:hypothetical protein